MDALDRTVAASEPISHTMLVLAVELAMHERGGRRRAIMRTDAVLECAWDRMYGVYVAVTEFPEGKRHCSEVYRP